MIAEKQINLQELPDHAQQEVYDFYLFIKQRVHENRIMYKAGESALLSESSLSEDWDKREEDEAWQIFQ